ncbi:hypothetical protein ABEB36_014255 [Hypothenemus hampei]|uniref:Transmembrane protein 120 homolog n=1 Tax=Hypothenemus hampei TaxID=57062 RepID=A0ABD1E8D9_HYPHA
MDDIKLQWSDLCKDYKQLEVLHQNYLKTLKQLEDQQQRCLSQIKHQRYGLNSINSALKKYDKGNEQFKKEIKEESAKREAQLQLIEDTLPRQGGWYLKVILGQINVGFLSEDAKFQYKDAYEKFKLICIIIASVLVIMNITVNVRFLQKLYLFFLVWYYCTLTIRESILRANGSKIKTWWRIHHALTVLASFVLLVWPENTAWDDFKSEFFRYNLYNCLVQYLQFNYQRGALYRLRALGMQDNMTITFEGFQHWMWRGLAFLFPFLFISYLYQLVNAYLLFDMFRYHKEATWHVMVTAGFMFVFFLGNTITTLLVIPAKLKKEMMIKYKVMAEHLYNKMSITKSNSKNNILNSK